MEARPIFIGGVERSGTSLLYALLTSHPNIAMTRRTNLWPYFFQRYGDLNQPENLERCLAVMQQYRRVTIMNPDFERIRQELALGKASYERLFTLLWQQYAQRQGKPRWGDKSLNTERYAGEIFRTYPGAKILHIVRDPRDRYASALKRWKVIRGGVGSGTGMWLASVRIGEHNLRRYPQQYRMVRYESLAQQPEATLREICAFLGEDYLPEMLLMQGAEAFRDDGGNSSFEQHAPGTISARSIGRYRKYLQPQAIAFIQQVAGQPMLDYDYPLDPVSLPAEKRWRYRLVDVPLNLARLALWSGREKWFDRTGRSIPAARMLKEAAEASAGMAGR